MKLCVRSWRLAVPLAAALFAGTGVASADTFVKFYYGGPGYTGQFSGNSGPATVYSLTKSLPGPSTGTNCPSPGGCGSPTDVIGGIGSTMAFSGTAVTATAGGNSHAVVWDDLAPPYGGLGVGLRSDTGAISGNDNIDGSDTLTINFHQVVSLKGVGTLFDPNHIPFNGDPSTATFLLSVDGGAFMHILFSNANLMLLAGLVGTTFKFMQDGINNPTFYVSAVLFSPVPLPAALPLFATGLGAMGLLGWRRKRKAQAVAA